MQPRALVHHSTARNRAATPCTTPQGSTPQRERSNAGYIRLDPHHGPTHTKHTHTQLRGHQLTDNEHRMEAYHTVRLLLGLCSTRQPGTQLATGVHQHPTTDWLALPRDMGPSQTVEDTGHHRVQATAMLQGLVRPGHSACTNGNHVVDSMGRPQQMPTLRSTVADRPMDLGG
jgi:hypothetical protein